MKDIINPLPKIVGECLYNLFGENGANCLESQDSHLKVYREFARHGICTVTESKKWPGCFHIERVARGLVQQSTNKSFAEHYS